MSGIRLWRGDICDLEADAIVVPATPSLWMTNGVAAAVKQRGGHGIEFEAVRRAPAPLGSAIATAAGALRCRHVIHVVSLTAERRTSAAGIEAATRAALELADQLSDRVVAVPSLGSPLGGVPLAECARIMVTTLHDTLSSCRAVDEVVIALRSGPSYDAFLAALHGSRSFRADPVEPGAQAPLAGVMDLSAADEIDAEHTAGPRGPADAGAGDPTGRWRWHAEGVR